mmetsp:Transcript_11870/g.27464  ORF Transcript_11870/g.27464 Transcript_11870/m.27464 type:complete len:218 (-) Transcript_11870:724-1377(-)
MIATVSRPEKPNSLSMKATTCVPLKCSSACFSRFSALYGASAAVSQSVRPVLKYSGWLELILHPGAPSNWTHWVGPPCGPRRSPSHAQLCRAIPSSTATSDAKAKRSARDLRRLCNDQLGVSAAHQAWPAMSRPAVNVWTTPPPVRSRHGPLRPHSPSGSSNSSCGTVNCAQPAVPRQRSRHASTLRTRDSLSSVAPEMVAGVCQQPVAHEWPRSSV